MQRTSCDTMRLSSAVSGYVGYCRFLGSSVQVTDRTTCWHLTTIYIPGSLPGELSVRSASVSSCTFAHHMYRIQNKCSSHALWLCYDPCAARRDWLTASSTRAHAVYIPETPHTLTITIKPFGGQTHDTNYTA